MSIVEYSLMWTQRITLVYITWSFVKQVAFLYKVYFEIAKIQKLDTVTEQNQKTLLWPAADRIEKRFNSVEKVICILLALALGVFIVLTTYLYCTWINDPSKKDEDDDYLGFVRSFFILLVWDALYKVFICVILFRCVYFYYKGKDLSGSESPSYDMSQNLIWIIIVTAILSCITAFIDLIYVFAIFMMDKDPSDLDNYFVMWLFTSLSLVGTDILIMSVLFALHSLIKHMYNKLKTDKDNDS